jgi:hypothetical protein
MRSGVQGIAFPSKTGIGRNVVVFLDNTRPRDIAIFNRSAMLAELERLGKRRS